MKKYGLWIGMLLAVLAILLADRTASILMTPTITPAEFLNGMPSWTLSFFGQSFILIQPSSTLFVYLLGLIMIALGLVFLRTLNHQQSRRLFGIGLILWGIGTLLAGTSYQAFGYVLKCDGLEACTFTSKFELIYLLITGFSIDFMVAAIAYTSLIGQKQRVLINIALLHSIAYFFLLFLGVIVPIHLLITYEFFMAFYLGSFLVMFLLNIRHYRLHKDLLNQRLILIWSLFLLVNVGYFIALFANFSATLYETTGLWFNANDVLHLLIIGWAFAIFYALKPTMKDTDEPLKGRITE